MRRERTLGKSGAGVAPGELMKNKFFARSMAPSLRDPATEKIIKRQDSKTRLRPIAPKQNGAETRGSEKHKENTQRPAR